MVDAAQHMGADMLFSACVFTDTQDTYIAIMLVYVHCVVFFLPHLWFII